MKRFNYIRELIVCLLIGGFLLPVLAGCEASEFHADPSVQEIVADSTPTLAEIGELSIEQIQITLLKDNTTITDADTIEAVAETLRLAETKVTKATPKDKKLLATLELFHPAYETLTVSMWKDFDCVRVDAQPTGTSKMVSQMYRLFYLDSQILQKALYDAAGVSTDDTASLDDLLSEPIRSIATYWGDTPINDPAAVQRIARSLASIELREGSPSLGCVVMSICNISFESGESIHISNSGGVVTIRHNLTDGTGVTKYYSSDSINIFSELLESYSHPRFYTPTIDFEEALSPSEYLQLPIDEISCKVSPQANGTRYFRLKEEILAAQAMLSTLQLTEIDAVELLTDGSVIKIEFTDFSLQLQFDSSGYMQLSLYDYAGTLQRSQWYRLPQDDVENITQWVQESFSLSIA